MHRTAILIYHRVAEVASDPLLLCVRPRHFAEHLEVLRRSYLPLSLSTLVDGLRAGRMPDRGIVLTFDDGYADNLTQGRPLLERHDVPATVFVTTGEAGRPRELWWDELEQILLQPGRIENPLRLRVGDGTGPGTDLPEYDLGAAAAYTDEDFRRCSGWTVLDRETPTIRQHLYRMLHDGLRKASPETRWRILDDLRARSNVPAAVRATHRPLRPDEIRKLAEGGLVEIGAHTVRHPVLSSLAVAEQHAEIVEGKARLEAMLDRPVQSFSYPYGCRSDYTAETIGVVRAAGFTCACANLAGLVDSDADPYQLPRVLVRDWGGDEFARRLMEIWNAPGTPRRDR